MTSRFEAPVPAKQYQIILEQALHYWTEKYMLKQVLRKLRREFSDNSSSGSTHWQGCEKDHWKCRCIGLIDKVLADTTKPLGAKK